MVVTMTLDSINSDIQQSFSKRLFAAKLQDISRKLNQAPVAPVKLLDTNNGFEQTFKNIEKQIIKGKKNSQQQSSSSPSDCSKYTLLNRVSNLVI